MMEYWWGYSLATGALRFSGSGPEGMALKQGIPDGCGIVEMPFAAWAALNGDAPNLDPLKTYIKAMVDDAAGELRRKFITTIPGQAETYLYKANEARAWVADNTAATPLMTPEAVKRGMTLEALADEVLANEAAWLVTGGKIESERVAAKEAIGAATNIGAIVEAASIDWNAVISAT